MGFEKQVSYVDIVRKVLGRGGAIVTYIAICLTSLGACSGYLIFWFVRHAPTHPHVPQKLTLRPFHLSPET